MAIYFVKLLNSFVAPDTTLCESRPPRPAAVSIRRHPSRFARRGGWRRACEGVKKVTRASNRQRAEEFRRAAGCLPRGCLSPGRGCLETQPAEMPGRQLHAHAAPESLTPGAGRTEPVEGLPRMSLSVPLPRCPYRFARSARHCEDLRLKSFARDGKEPDHPHDPRVSTGRRPHRRWGVHRAVAVSGPMDRQINGILLGSGQMRGGFGGFGAASVRVSRPRPGAPPSGKVDSAHQIPRPRAASRIESPTARPEDRKGRQGPTRADAWCESGIAGPPGRRPQRTGGAIHRFGEGSRSLLGSGRRGWIMFSAARSES